MKNKQIAEESRQTLKNNFKICFLICLLSTIISNSVTLLEKSIPTLIISIALFIITPALSYGIIMCFMKIHKDDSEGDSTKIFDFITLGLQNLKKAWSIIFRTLLKIWPQLLLFLLACIIALMLSFSTFKEILISSNTSMDLLSISVYSIFYVFGVFFIILLLYLIFIFPKILYYNFSDYIMIDNNNSITAKEAVEKSEELMKNNRLKYFKYILGFIGWYFLASIIINIISNFVKNIFDLNNYTIITYIVGMIITPIITAYIQMANVHFYESLKQENKEI